ncbi:XRE family transcriptional regulator [Streptomyces diacarni]|uniref:XRE family transcriptional regulator n=1 Tax=Streptomyces diacarni TaxID=2800381 RepID=A0A367FCP1_9ACTN|nr:helix-turn-helix transcriptional regulator [Streptomyces diacarni]RCG28128.1 XRE family transcriptional regulator [Streptomyces diacarni]
MDQGGDSAETVAFGQRVRVLRVRRGMSREVLAGLVGRSVSWVKQIEGGRLQMPKLPMVLRLAEVLRVGDLAELTGEHSMPVALFTGPGHRRLPQVRAAIDAFPFDARSREAPAATQVRARLTEAWAARHAAAHHRDVLGALLPALVEDAQLAVHQARTASRRREAHAVLAETYALSQFFLAYQPDSALLWRTVERGLVAAQESEDPHAIGVAAWLAAQAHRDSGHSHFDAADAVTEATLRHLEPLLPDADADVRAIAGALRFEAGYTAARRGETGSAWRHWDAARATAQRLPTGYFHPVTSFSRAVMGAHAVTVAVELHAGAEGSRQAAAADTAALPSRPRRARHHIERARAYQLDGRPEESVNALAQAYETAPETIRYNGHARRILLEESAHRSPERRRRAARLATRVGVMSS